MKWRKLGRLFDAPAAHPKLATHAANPLAVHQQDDRYRVFYSGRDERNRSSVGWVDVDIARLRVLEVGDRPAFEFGPPGSFYSDGVSIGNCFAIDGNRYLGFMGWQNRQGSHWRGDVGLLRLDDDLGLTLAGQEPWLGASEIDPVSLSYPWVERAGDGYRMWYGSTIAWDAGNGEMLHVINQAVSPDGRLWSREGLAVPFALGTAQAFSRPCVIVDAVAGWNMWFSYRSGSGTPYRIGRASSSDGVAWRLRMVDPGIVVSGEGWDSEMLAYPFVFRHRDDWFLLYNGNGYGRTGVGIAVLEQQYGS